MIPKVTLISWTDRPIETVYVLWHASKDENELIHIDDVDEQEALELFNKVVAQNIPIGEHLNFVFMLENVSVSFREQMVRHRIGTTVGDRLGADIVPDLSQSSWWSQSMRIMDMGTFYSQGHYRIPATVTTERSLKTYLSAMKHSQDAYNWLVSDGVPMEDARELIPLGAQHRISWALNLSALQHIIGKRSCWILQAPLWLPIIEGMVDELCEKIHPVFRNLAKPPCINSANRYKQCAYQLENERRVDGLDAHDPCPLYLSEHSMSPVPWDNEAFQERKAQYLKLWGDFYY